MKRFLLLAIAVALALMAQENLQRRLVPTDSVVLYGIAVVLFLWAVRQGRAQPAVWVAKAASVAGRPLTRWDALIPALALVPMAMALLAWNDNHFSTPQSTYALYIYLAGLALFCYGVYEVGKVEGSLPESFARILSPRAELLAVAGITAIGAFMVFYRLDSLPFGVWYDESDSALEALQILNGAPYSPVAFHFRFNPSLYFQYVAIVFRLFGVGVEQIRFASASTALLAIPALYVLARDLAGQRVAIVAAFLLAVSRWQFDLARWGMFYVSSTVFAVLAIHFLLRALRFRRWSDFAWAGLFLGGGLHTYTAFRLIPVAAAGMAGYWVLTQDLIPALRRAGVPTLLAVLQPLVPRFAALAIAAMVALGPFGLFAIQNPGLINERLDQASVFARKETTEQRVQALTSNIEKHLLMFNYRGDSNGRHNLPGEPMLDPTVGAFFILGVAYSLYRWRDPVRVAVLLWLAVGLQGGILSLDFEAPQALRTLPVVPAVCLLAAWPLADTWEAARGFARSWAWSARGRLVAGTVVCVFLGLLLFRIGYYNYETYFVRQANDFAVWNAYSTPETLAARRAVALGSGYAYYIADYFRDHPTLRFLVPWLKDYQVVSSDLIFPLRRTGDKPVAIFLDAQKSTAFNAGRRYYPSGTFVAHTPPFGGPVSMYEIVLSPDDIRSVQGLNARYYLGTLWQGETVLERREPRVEADWRSAAPLTGAFSVEWQGTLYVAMYGQQVLAMTAPAAAQVYVDEYLVLEVGSAGGTAEKSVLLAKGNHALRVRAVGGAGTVRLAWQPAGGARETIPQESLYVPPVVASGLLGNYYRNTDWSGAPALAQVDPSLNLYFHFPLLPRPYSVEWLGKVDAPVSGTYAFGLESIDDSWLYLDNQPAAVVEAHVGNVLSEGRVNLSAGLHDIRVRFLDKTGYSHVNLYWTIPGKGREPVPSERLYPPQGAYPTPVPGTSGLVSVAPLPVSTPTPPGPAAPMAPLAARAAWGGPGSEEGQFDQPRDVAVNSRGEVFVADTGNRRVQRFDREGNFQAVLSGEYEEPLALVVGANDSLYVLDSAPGWIYRYDSAGVLQGRFGGPSAQLYHPRGLAVDVDGNLYVADTGGCQIVKFSPSGEVVAKIGSKGTGPGQFVEPTDVVVDISGQMYVADAGNRRVVRLDGAGGHLGEWAIPRAGAFNGPHLALGPDGQFYMTDPETGRLLVYDRAGRLVQETGRAGVGLGEFRLPVGVFVDQVGRVFVAEVGNDRLQVLTHQP